MKDNDLHPPDNRWVLLLLNLSGRINYERGDVSVSARILLTGFRNSSSQKLLRYAQCCDTLLLPNHKVLDGELLIHQLNEKSYDLVICLGQKPNLKDKICLETTAHNSVISMQTMVACEKLKCHFFDNGMNVRLSHNAGTSFCNALYFHGLDYIFANNLRTHLVFIHIPFEKNISDPSAFYERFLDSVEQLLIKGVDLFGKDREI